MLRVSGPNLSIPVQTWGYKNIPKVPCKGREAFFSTAPFAFEKTLKFSQITRNQPFFRAVFNNAGALKLVEAHGSRGEILTVTLYSSVLAPSEIEAIKGGLCANRIHYSITEETATALKRIEFPVHGGGARSTEYFSPEMIGKSTETIAGTKTETETVFSLQGQALVKETYDAGENLVDISDARGPFVRKKYFGSAEGIGVGRRSGFTNMVELQKIAETQQGSIELALPNEIEQFNAEVRGKADQLVQLMKKSRLNVTTLHASKGKISGPEFLFWGEETMRLADALGSETVTFHPDKVGANAPIELMKRQTIESIRFIQRSHRAAIAIETFAGKNRILSFDDLVTNEIPIVLDVAHIQYRDSIRLIREHTDLIKTIHLSAKANDQHHLPVDQFCLAVLEEAMGRGWKGNVVLEYLPKYHGLLGADALALGRFISEG